MRKVVIVWLGLGVLTCGSAAPADPKDEAGKSDIVPTGHGDAVDRDVVRAREATARFKDVNAAIDAGYNTPKRCIVHPERGVMGFHYNNPTLQDGTLDVEHPEILLYAPAADGGLKLTGVEYIVPLDAWPQPKPPHIMGQKMRRAEKLGIWYLHVWIWEHNTSGIFANWNPGLKC